MLHSRIIKRRLECQEEWVINHQTHSQFGLLKDQWEWDFRSIRTDTILLSLVAQASLSSLILWPCSYYRLVEPWHRSQTKKSSLVLTSSLRFTLPLPAKTWLSASNSAETTQNFVKSLDWITSVCSCDWEIQRKSSPGGTKTSSKSNFYPWRARLAEFLFAVRRQWTRPLIELLNSCTRNSD